jgi:hypothetical protein
MFTRLLAGLRSCAFRTCDICAGNKTFVACRRVCNVELERPTRPSSPTAAIRIGKRARKPWKARLAAIIVTRSWAASVTTRFARAGHFDGGTLRTRARRGLVVPR